MLLHLREVSTTCCRVQESAFALESTNCKRSRHNFKINRPKKGRIGGRAASSATKAHPVRGRSVAFNGTRAKREQFEGSKPGQWVNQ